MYAFSARRVQVAFCCNICGTPSELSFLSFAFLFKFIYYTTVVGMRPHYKKRALLKKSSVAANLSSGKVLKRTN